MQSKNSTIEDFEKWLAGLGLAVKPSLHVNTGYTTALVVLDLGTPKVPLNLSQEVVQEMKSRLRDSVASLSGKRSVRVQEDHQQGVIWAGY